MPPHSSLTDDLYHKLSSLQYLSVTESPLSKCMLLKLTAGMIQAITNRQVGLKYATGLFNLTGNLADVSSVSSRNSSLATFSPVRLIQRRSVFCCSHMRVEGRPNAMMMYVAIESV